jgi:hypothetical protein
LLRLLPSADELAGALHFVDPRLTCVVGEGEVDLRLCRGRVLADDMAAVEDVPPLLSTPQGR